MDEGHYHFHAEPLQRSKGHSSLAAASYRCAERLYDDRTGITHDFTRRHGVVHSEILLPDGSPEWAKNRQELWNKVEAINTRKDAQTARMLDFGLPHQLTAEQRLDLTRAFLKDVFVKEGMVADFAIHEPHGPSDQRNHHAHVMLSLRKMGPRGLDRVNTREWNSKKLLQQWRVQWSTYANDALARHAHAVRIDHRSYKDRGDDRVKLLTPQQLWLKLVKCKLVSTRIIPTPDNPLSSQTWWHI